ncbi:MAG: ammonium transporter [Alphaproteobacteria bacterium]|nr:ammonium transporter [Alphaproteobacteria bacterium]
MLLDDRIDILWVIAATTLVFVMQAGFACVETGFVRAKNSINVAVKNMIDFCVAGACFWLFGYGLAFGSSWGGWIGTNEFAFQHDTLREGVFFLFMLMFCGTATTIVSGAVAERMRYGSYVILSLLMSGFIYPPFVHWAWGGMPNEPTGWLGRLGFVDFAGSTVVHSVGGWMALAAILVLKPRLGRFAGKTTGFTGSNLALSTLGVFLLWFGWFGFNGGSALALTDRVPYIVVNTVVGGCVGGLTAALVSMALFRQTRVELLLNGVLAGLVSVTAGCNALPIAAAALVGSIGGGLSIVGAHLLDRLKIDDAVGAVPVHLFAGIWGTVAVALFGDAQFLPHGDNRLYQALIQLLGIAAAGLWAFGGGLLLVLLVNRVMPLRVSEDAERLGLNIAEHGARTAIGDLISAMESHRRNGDFRTGVPVEPESDVELIARQYNRVAARIDDEIGARAAAIVELARQRRMADEASQAKSAFLANMSHELRTPLNAIIGFADLLGHEPFGPIGDERYRDYANAIKTGGNHLLSLVNDLLDLAKIEAGRFDVQLAEWDLPTLIGEVAELLDREATSKGVVLNAEVDDGLRVVTDHRALRQILFNLIGNAIKFTAAGGQVRVVARGVTAGVELTIVDTGCGMNTQDIQRALEPFVQLEQAPEIARTGTGLGLAVSRALVDMLGGRLQIASEPGVGTRITITLPAHPLPAAA